MFLSNLLGPVKKPIFEILYRSALRAAVQLEESGIELRTFANRFLRLARADKLKIEVVENERYCYLIEKIAWLIIIPPEQNLQMVSRVLWICSRFCMRKNNGVANSRVSCRLSLMNKRVRPMSRSPICGQPFQNRSSHPFIVRPCCVKPPPKV